MNKTYVVVSKLGTGCVASLIIELRTTVTSIPLECASSYTWKANARGYSYSAILSPVLVRPSRSSAFAFAASVRPSVRPYFHTRTLSIPDVRSLVEALEGGSASEKLLDRKRNCCRSLSVRVETDSSLRRKS